MVCAALKPDTASIFELMDSKNAGKLLTSTTNDNNSWSHLAIGTMIESDNEFKGDIHGEKTLKNRNRVRWGRCGVVLFVLA
jgi:hypothetical protein